MAEITAKLVSELREKTGAGMMVCKQALSDTSGDIEAAIDLLRQKGQASAAKKAGRAAAQGLISAMTKDNKGVMIELNSETDFVAKNAEFQAFLKEVTELAVQSDDDIESLKAAKLGSTGKSVADSLTDLIAKIGENMTLRRLARVSVNTGSVMSYIHNQVVPGQGTIGVLVALESDGENEKICALAKQIAMHIAATSPVSLSVDDIDPALVEREKAIFTEQAKESGKPADIIEKMIGGRIRKYYEEVVLLEQNFVMEPDKKVKDVVASLAKDLGKDVKLSAFVRFGLGEGVEKKEVDFAAEVAEQLKK